MEDMPPGFRFYPTEEELLSFYLHNMLEGKREHLNNLINNRVIPVVDIYGYNPTDPPQFSVSLCHKGTEQWVFFVPRNESEARGGRPKRLTDSGYWKATGSPSLDYASDDRTIGFKRTMVFYNGRAPSGGHKTDWKMNEYKAFHGEASLANGAQLPPLRQEFSLCRVYTKSKCLRSLDRRPMAGAVQISRQVPQHVKYGFELTESLPESSSLGDKGNQMTQTEKIMTMNIPFGL
ncbi:vacuolar protein sorting-associated protein 55-like protein isoform X1 [Hibiscus syriacus]|uniref:Vacuolar protein sorting-associated protein 55-like protein isoform X1 n=1 Tax=Hibiscus syriacus TaxID=106335 RepID=A0A6A3B2E7_HIBSY|nr:NAC domain-containing protein 90-like [Hibiscus syriacus]KAE8711120.1 vacuolar protein sorting-associated protein 55-like protein isoform X1 [Hibiscus syriacus]